MALLLRLRGGNGEGWACGRKARASFLDVGESLELPHRTLLCFCSGGNAGDHFQMKTHVCTRPAHAERQRSD